MSVALALLLLVGASPDSIPSGEDVIRAMHDRYAGAWYRNLVLIQSVTYFDRESGGVDHAEIWYESIRLPGTVRADVAPLDDGNSELYKDGVGYRFRGDSVVGSRAAPHPVLLLGFDVYLQPVDVTIRMLREMGVDLSKVHEATWHGRAVWVVGAAGPHDDANQFAIDRQDLLLRRCALRTPAGVQWEVWMEGYERLGGGWIATDLVFLRDGAVSIKERYAYWSIDVEFDESLFATEGRTRPTWIRQ